MAARTCKWRSRDKGGGYIINENGNQRQTARIKDLVRYAKYKTALTYSRSQILQRPNTKAVTEEAECQQCYDKQRLMAALPLAAVNLQEAFNVLRGSFRKVYDQIYFGDMLPPVGSLRLSYARFMQLMHDRMVKRVYIMGEGRMALVEIPVTGWASDYDTQKFDRRNPEIMYCKERPEWQMEKWRFYVELPGDFWTESDFMVYFKNNLPHRTHDDRVRYDQMLKEHQVIPEIVVVDPGENLIWVNQFSGQLLPIFGLVILRVIVGLGSQIGKLLGLEKKDKETQMAEQFQKHKAVAYGVEEEVEGEKTKKKKDTGVRFADVAGIDMVIDDIQEILSMLMGDDRYLTIGCQPPRGILLEGPPGTGKTYLAKAMAGEAGLPFYSANGAEFVEMFQGVASARVRSLFAAAKKRAPAIIFIDEIDAIGKSRTDGSRDSGSSEREQGLMQLLIEMDGFKPADKILVIGATNRIDVLDAALLRPGRFDRKIYMGRPTVSNRLKILQVHARNKVIEGETEEEQRALLQRVAELAIGYSGADLANLLNEAAILAVRQDLEAINFNVFLDAMEKIRVGLTQQSLPESTAKRRLATVQAGRAVIFALSPGLPPIENVTIQPKGGTIGRILYIPQEAGKFGDDWHKLFYPEGQANLANLSKVVGSFEFCINLLVPLYAARATEEVFFGKEGVTLSTSKEVSTAGELAHWMVARSTLHPSFRNSPLQYRVVTGDVFDPSTSQTENMFEHLTLKLQRLARNKAQQMIKERRDAIEIISEELCSNKSSRVTGSRIVEILKERDMGIKTLDGLPLSPERQTELSSFESFQLKMDQLNKQPQKQLTQADIFNRHIVGSGVSTFSDTPGCTGYVVFNRQMVADEIGLEEQDVFKAAMVVVGDLDLADILPKEELDEKYAEAVAQLQDKQIFNRLAAVRRYATDVKGDFPPPPTQEEILNCIGPNLKEYLQREAAMS